MIMIKRILPNHYMDLFLRGQPLRICPWTNSSKTFIHDRLLGIPQAETFGEKSSPFISANEGMTNPPVSRIPAT